MPRATAGPPTLPPVTARWRAMDRLAPDELLAHLEWMGRLARALVGGDEAADLAQEGMTAALARPPTTERPVHPWLAAVLRNLAQMRARTGGRRRRREVALVLD